MRAVPVATSAASHSERVRYDVRSVLSRSEAPHRTLLPGVGRPALHGLSKRPCNFHRGPFPQDPTTCPAEPAVPGVVPASREAVLGHRLERARPNSQCSTHELDKRHSLLPMLLRKEVIQPHLPVRLPCYDFVPIADPTFDSSLPCGLGHWLRVLPTFVT